MTMIAQLSPFFLVCIGVQIAQNGIKALLESVMLHIGCPSGTFPRALRRD
jgi:hypothetical protein